MLQTFDLLNRLKIWQKLALVAFAFAVPLALTTFFLLDEKSIKIEFARSELYGDEYLRPCARALESVVSHRALMLLAGSDANSAENVKETEERTDEALHELDAVDKKLGQRLATSAEELRYRHRQNSHPAALERSWQQTRAAAPNANVSDELHAKLIVDLRNLVTHVGDSSKLILDPDLDTYYTMDSLLLRSPELVERLSTLESKIDGILSRGRATLIERSELAEARGLLAYQLSNLESDADTAIAEAPNFSNYAELKAKLAPGLNDAKHATRHTLALVTRLVEGEKIEVGRQEWHEAVHAAVASNVKYWNTLLDAEDVMLRLRMGGDLGRRSFALWSVVLALALTLGLALLVLRSITLPIARAADVARRLARGELPESVEVGRGADETAMLLRAVNDMLGFLDLRRTITSLQDSAGTLSAAVTNLESHVSSQGSAATRQATALHETQVTTQEIKQTSQLAAEKASKVLQVAERAEAVSRSGERAIEKSVGGLTEIRRQVEEIVSKVGELNSRTQQIGVITQTVKDLADQSNMLALNAAIEAVRSGEHGKGFAVVAREIRSLADQSVQATNRVNEILEAVSVSIRDVVTIAETGRRRIEAGIEEVRSSGENLEELSGIVRESSQSARQIAAAVSQQDAGISQIFTAVSDQSRLMEDAVSRLEDSRTIIQKVQDVASRVHGVVSRFQTSEPLPEALAASQAAGAT
ncbi:MAG TPA: methyl-accepting chemotaxis protein [Polyangiaceae bacterium]|nr:methyl-accepting chemotaxis protein [Polyangiaceae bacterium]